MKTPEEIYDEMPSGSLDDLTGKDILTLDQAVELAEKYHEQYERPCIRMKSGTIVLVSGRDTQARIIQKFQQLTDKEAGRFNHSGLILNLNGKDYILEMSYIRNRKTRAACVIRPLTVYQDGKHELLFLHPKLFYNSMDFEALALSFTGTPYAYSKLLFNIPRSILFNRVTDPKDKRPDRYFGDKNNERQLVCHMLSQLVWHRFVADGIFPRWYSGDVAELYWSPDFERVEG